HECRLCGLRLAFLQKRLRGDESIVRAAAALFFRPCWRQQRGFLHAVHGRAHAPRADAGGALREGLCLLALYHCRRGARRGAAGPGAPRRFNGDGKLHPSIADHASGARQRRGGRSSALPAALDARFSIRVSARGAHGKRASRSARRAGALPEVHALRGPETVIPCRSIVPDWSCKCVGKTPHGPTSISDAFGCTLGGTNHILLGPIPPFSVACISYPSLDRRA